MNIIESFKTILVILSFVFLAGIVLFTLSSLGGAVNENDKAFYCGDNPEMCR